MYLTDYDHKVSIIILVSIGMYFTVSDHMVNIRGLSYNVFRGFDSKGLEGSRKSHR